MKNMAEQPLCPECDRPMNFVVAKLTEDETPNAADVKSGWYCPDCGIFKPTEMSGGQQQRVAIARSLANDPEVILADEPTGNLDSKTSVKIVQLLSKLHKERGKTVIVVTHDRDMTKYAKKGKIYNLLDGRIVQ